MGDVYIGRGSRQCSLSFRNWCNNFKVARSVAIQMFSERLQSDASLQTDLWQLSGTRLACHCTPNQDCRGDSKVARYRQRYSAAYDRDDATKGPPSSDVLHYLAKLREEPEDEGGHYQTKEHHLRTQGGEASVTP